MKLVTLCLQLIESLQVGLSRSDRPKKIITKACSSYSLTATSQRVPRPSTVIPLLTPAQVVYPLTPSIAVVAAPLDKAALFVHLESINQPSWLPWLRQCKLLSVILV